MSDPFEYKPRPETAQATTSTAAQPLSAAAERYQDDYASYLTHRINCRDWSCSNESLLDCVDNHSTLNCDFSSPLATWSSANSPSNPLRPAALSSAQLLYLATIRDSGDVILIDTTESEPTFSDKACAWVDSLFSGTCAENAREIVDGLKSIYKEKPLALSLESIANLRTVAHYLTAKNMQEGSDSPKFWDNVLQDITSILASEIEHPMLRLAATATRLALGDPEHLISLGLSEVTDWGVASRDLSLTEFVDSRRLEHSYSTSIKPEISGELVFRRISKDAMAICNSYSLEPLYYAKIREEQILEYSQQPRSALALRNLLVARPHPQTSAKQKLGWLLRIHQEIVAPSLTNTLDLASSTMTDDHSSSPMRLPINPKSRQFFQKVVDLMQESLAIKSRYRAGSARSAQDLAHQRTNCFDRDILPSIEKRDLPPYFSELLFEYTHAEDPLIKHTFMHLLLEALPFDEGVDDWLCDLDEEYDWEDLELGEYFLYFWEEPELKRLYEEPGLEWLKKSDDASSVNLAEPRPFIDEVCDVHEEEVTSLFDDNQEAICTWLEELLAARTRAAVSLQEKDYVNLPDDSDMLGAKSQRYGIFENEFVAIARVLDTPETRQVIESLLGFNLNKLSRINQIHLFRFLQDCDQAAFTRLKACFHRHPTVAHHLASALISYADSSEAANSLFSLSEKLPSAQLSEALQGFLKITDAVTDAELVIGNTYSNLHSSAVVESIRQQTVNRATAFLKDWASRLTESQNPSNDIQKFLQLANHLSGNSVITAALYKQFCKDTESEGLVRTLEQISIHQYPAPKLSDEQRDALIAVHRYNSERCYPADFSEPLIKSFRDSLDDEDCRFYLLTIGGKIEGFAKFKDLGPGRKYFGSFNANPELKSLGLGNYFLQEMLAIEGEDSQIKLYVDDASGLETFYGKLGFETQTTHPNFSFNADGTSPTSVTLKEMIREPG